MAYNLLINGIYWGYNPFTNHLLTSWDIQAELAANSLWELETFEALNGSLEIAKMLLEYKARQWRLHHWEFTGPKKNNVGPPFFNVSLGKRDFLVTSDHFFRAMLSMILFCLPAILRGNDLICECFPVLRAWPSCLLGFLGNCPWWRSLPTRTCCIFAD